MMRSVARCARIPGASGRDAGRRSRPPWHVTASGVRPAALRPAIETSNPSRTIDSSPIDAVNLRPAASCTRSCPCAVRTMTCPTIQLPVAPSRSRRTDHRRSDGALRNALLVDTSRAPVAGRGVPVGTTLDQLVGTTLDQLVGTTLDQPVGTTPDTSATMPGGPDATTSVRPAQAVVTAPVVVTSTCARTVASPTRAAAPSSPGSRAAGGTRGARTAGRGVGRATVVVDGTTTEVATPGTAIDDGVTTAVRTTVAVAPVVGTTTAGSTAGSTVGTTTPGTTDVRTTVSTGPGVRVVRTVMNGPTVSTGPVAGTGSPATTVAPVRPATTVAPVPPEASSARDAVTASTTPDTTRTPTSWSGRPRS